MNINLKLTKLVLPSAIALLLALGASPGVRAQDTGTVFGSMPRSIVTAARLIPVFGTSAFVTSPQQTFKYGDNGFSAGLFADFGSESLGFETGILALSTNAQRVGTSVGANIGSWGVPILAKYHFSGNPQQSVFAKAGVMPQVLTTLNSEIAWLGVAGLGAAIPLGQNSSLALDASYNHIVNTGTAVASDYQGVSLLGGLSFNL